MGSSLASAAVAWSSSSSGWSSSSISMLMCCGSLSASSVDPASRASQNTANARSNNARSSGRRTKVARAAQYTESRSLMPSAPSASVKVSTQPMGTLSPRPRSSLAKAVAIRCAAPSLGAGPLCATGGANAAISRVASLARRRASPCRRCRAVELARRLLDTSARRQECSSPTTRRVR